MKNHSTYQEAVYMEGLPDWYLQATPSVLWSRAAFDLFQAARAEGIIDYLPGADSWAAGPNMTRAQLAYFCKEASRCLRLNNGAHTNWAPFEIVFNGGYMAAPGPLRNNLRDLDCPTDAQRAQQRTIDRFFQRFEKRQAAIGGDTSAQAEAIQAQEETIRAQAARIRQLEETIQDLEGWPPRPADDPKDD